MATIVSLIPARLRKITTVLGPHEGQPIRELFVTPDMGTWITDILPMLPTENGAARTPEEEFDDLLFNYISSEGEMRYGKTFKDLVPMQDEVWELKTYQLRIFGWFYRKDQFIAVRPARKAELKNGSDAYHKAIKLVLDTRAALPLDEPKFVGGVITNVISGI
jgi:hypothetical protein